MKRKSPVVLYLAGFCCVLLTLPADLLAAPQSPGQRAGQVDRLIPAVGIARGSQTITASPKSVVFWQDQINTKAGARARISLDDGSILNVGSEASMRVVKHDAGAQQTDLELTYGKLRSQAVKITKPGGKFEVRTPAGVAGVVGTDFFIAFENGVMNVIVFEGIVRVCNLAGVCVDVKAGQMTSVRSGDNSPPLPPAPAPLDMLVQAGNDTTIAPKGQAPGIQQAGQHISKGTAITLGILAAIPAIVVPIVTTRGNNAALRPPPQCNPQTSPTGCG